MFTRCLFRRVSFTHNKLQFRFSSSAVERLNVRNVAIIAHVDHGKTTLVDRLLESTVNRLRSDGASTERLMDSNPLEQERGITILSKYTSVKWTDNRPKNELINGITDYHLNIVDTPGHADFGGEVERIMSMVDGVALLVDATEGPMTQTKFVLSKALKRGILPMLVINKVDRDTARLGEVENEIFDLFAHLGATEQQLDYPVIYASARDGWAVKDVTTAKQIIEEKKRLINEPGSEEKKEIAAKRNMNNLFETLVERIPPPKADISAPFSMLVTQLEGNDFFGKCLVGRIMTGSVKLGDNIKALEPAGGTICEGRVTKLLTRIGLEQVPITEAKAGDIVSVAGFAAATVNSTLCALQHKDPVPSVPIDPPTVSMTFSVNDSPLAGQEGEPGKMMSSAIKQRLLKEAETNVSIKVVELDSDSFEVRGRGELQLAVIIENLRREKYELAVAPPKVVFKEENGEILEPYEDVILDVPPELSNQVMEKMLRRKGDLKEFVQTPDGRSRLTFGVPTRGLIGYNAEFTTDTRGQGVLNHTFHSYVEHKGEIARNLKGALICIEGGKTTAYALAALEPRGTLFVAPGVDVYPGMVVGEHSKEGNLEVNPVKAKALTNFRSAGKDDKVRLAPPLTMTLEESIAYVRDDEIVEVTPTKLRLRKQLLDSEARKKAKRAALKK